MSLKVAFSAVLLSVSSDKMDKKEKAEWWLGATTPDQCGQSSGISSTCIIGQWLATFLQCQLASVPSSVYAKKRQ